MNYKEKKVAILGYEIEGHDAEKFLLSRGAEITILDQKDNPNYLDSLNKYDLVVRSPGVYPYKKQILEAGKLGARITTPTNIFFEEFKGTTIGVTGTKGKGTTSTLTYEILKADKKDVYLVGNIGKPLLEILNNTDKKSFAVMEMSSFQLIDAKASPNISVILNITSDHMDWHKSQKEYIDAKKNIVRFQKSSDWSLLNSEYETSKSFAKETKGNIMYFSKKLLDVRFKKDLQLKGEHNLENIAAAVAVSKILNIDQKLTELVVKSFKGLEHRLEFVSEVNGVKFYNDSFATGPQPTIAAIRSFTEPMTIILGGSDKGLDYRDLGREIEKHKNIKNVILIGETKLKIKNALENWRTGELEIVDLDKKSMTEIVTKAYKITPKGGVVLLSPASASFDMFKDYKDRGNQFKNAVLQLK